MIEDGDQGGSPMSIRNSAAALAFAAGLVAVALSSPAAANVQSSTSEPTESVPTPQSVVDSYSLIEDALFSEEPEMWGGAFVNHDVLVVKTVRYTLDEAAELVRAVGAAGSVRILSSGVSIKDLESAVDAILALHNPTVVSAGPRYATSEVVVGVSSDDPSSEAQISSATELTVSFEHAPGRPELDTRYYDVTPFWGGSLVAFANTSGKIRGCSSGFAWNSGGLQLMVSAGHCRVNANGRNFQEVHRRTASGWSYIGDVQWSSANEDGTKPAHHGDLTVYWVAQQYETAGRIYVGTYNTGQFRNVIGRKSLPEGWQGEDVFTSGAGPYGGHGSGEVMLDWISLINQTITFSNGMVMKNLSVGENADTCVGSGDSGGSVYQQSGSGSAYAVGIISGDNGQGSGWTNCRNYFTPISYVADDFGGSIKTS
jgi:hypothetical protein